MKRIVCLVLSLLMIVSMVSCSKKKEEAQAEVKKTAVDLSKLSGEELYHHGTEKMKALTSALYTTKILSGDEEIGEFETVRIRSGYDDFIYSRRGQGYYYFDGERAYTQSTEGAFTAPCNIRIFEEYLSSYVFSVCALTPALLENLQRDGDTVTYESEKEELLALYRLADKPDFTPLSLTGSARFDKEGVIQEERIVLRGEEEEYELHTVLTQYRSKDISIAAPTDSEEFVEISDIRLPLRLLSAIETLYAQKEIQTTIVSSDTVTFGENGGIKYLRSEDVTAYVKAEEGEYYISKQNLKQIPDVPVENVFYQALLTDGKKTEDRYNVSTGEKLWENSEKAKTLPWEEEISELLPALSDFASLTMSNEVGGYSITFTLTDEAAKKLGESLVNGFSEVGGRAVTVRSCTGTISIDHAVGMVTAFSYTLEGGLASDLGVGNYTGRYSILVDRTEDVTLPELQVPTANATETETEHEH